MKRNLLSYHYDSDWCSIWIVEYSPDEVEPSLDELKSHHWSKMNRLLLTCSNDSRSLKMHNKCKEKKIKFHTYSGAIEPGPVDCDVCRHAILFIGNLFTYTPNILWCRFKRRHAESCEVQDIINLTYFFRILIYTFARSITSCNDMNFYANQTKITSDVLPTLCKAWHETQLKSGRHKFHGLRWWWDMC